MLKLRKIFFLTMLASTIAIFFSACHCSDNIRCSLLPDEGPCEAAITKYYYDQDEKRCKEFLYGGCEGVVPFETMQECRDCNCH